MISLDLTSPVPPFEQIRGQVADLVRSGDLADGQRLPTVRQLAADLRVAPGTVARAYAQLEAEGLVRSQRSRGTRAVAPVSPAPAVRTSAEALVATARAHGLTLSSAEALLRAAWAAQQRG
ncbi:MAG: GntR family transcriptional regulator [Candidatus Nanopelagicales bacterium]